MIEIGTLIKHFLYFRMAVFLTPGGIGLPFQEDIIYILSGF